MNNDLSHWKRFLEWFCQSDGTGIRLDISRMGFDRSWWDTMQSSMANALVEMEKLESGAVANPDENRMVGHYWLRNPDIAPNDEIREKIRKNLNSLHHFSERVLDGRIKPPNAKRFSRLLLIGIGGSALGPQLLYQALEGIPEKEKSLSGLETFFIDNTDPEGMARIYKKLGDSLKETLVLVISKSGGTVETRNGMLETRNAFKSKNLNFAGQAVAVTGEGSLLAQLAHSEEWLGVFPMWDW
ncbi:MAG: glucose-6-phosphate isomerase, partial [SAR324 cluster bacterium]|nr:glucose-6-phosphate isomerase [SAR324 cluster bacterium]